MILIKTPVEIKALAESNRIVAKVLREIKKIAKPGITTESLNDLAEKIAVEENAIPGFKGYKGFPYSICASVNDEVVHGFPNNEPLKEGDILSIDFGILKNNYYGDSAITIPIGRVGSKEKSLLETTYGALMAGIDVARPGNKIGHISHAIQEMAEKNGFNVIRDFTGHGIGRNLHEDPYVENFIDNDTINGYILKPGMTIAIEPMLVEGDWKTKTKSNGWTVITADGGLSAHFEHTIVITSNGPEILSK